MPLFRRLAKNGYREDDYKELLKCLKYVSRNAGDIIFSEDDYMYIVLNGRVVLRYHQEDPLEYIFIAQYISGSVIGYDKLDHGMSSLS